jgi:hypothetical protein
MLKNYTVVLLHPDAAGPQDQPVVSVRVASREEVDEEAKKQAANLWNEDDDTGSYAPEEFGVCAVFPGDICCV